MARGGFPFCGGSKSEREAAASETKRAYGSRRAPGEMSLEGKAEGSAPHPSLKGQSERKAAYSVSSFRCSRVVRFFRISSIQYWDNTTPRELKPGAYTL